MCCPPNLVAEVAISAFPVPAAFGVAISSALLVPIRTGLLRIVHLIIAISGAVWLGLYLSYLTEPDSLKQFAVWDLMLFVLPFLTAFLWVLMIGFLESSRAPQHRPAFWGIVTSFVVLGLSVIARTAFAG